MGYRKKHWFCSLLAALCLLSALPRMESLARVAVDTGMKCTLSITMTLNQPGGNWDDLKKAEVKVDVCRIASMDEAGAYTPLGTYRNSPELTAALTDLNQHPDRVTVDFWKTQAETAAQIFTGAHSDRNQDYTGADGIWTISVKNGLGTQGELPVGLYLVCPREVKTDEYRYTFEPYLVSLPGNAYGTVPDGGGTPSEDDTWLYKVSVGLKPEQHVRYGDLTITKTLTQHNAALGPAVFVFQVTGTKDMDGDGTPEVVYSNVHSLSFTKADSQTATIEKLPAGTIVTVEEVYAGSAYEATDGAKKENITITAREAYDTPQTGGTPQPGGDSQTTAGDEVAKVSFSNNYNGGLTPGSGITNHFTYEKDSGSTGGTSGTGPSGTWKLEQIYHRLTGNTGSAGNSSTNGEG